VAILAQRASISRTTLNKVEKGDAGVSLGSYTTVLFALGMVDRPADLADPRGSSVYPHDGIQGRMSSDGTQRRSNTMRNLWAKRP
jgi:hypothetical protein